VTGPRSAERPRWSRHVVGAVACIAVLGCRAAPPVVHEVSPLVGRWVWTSYPRPADRRAGWSGLLGPGPGDHADVHYDTLTLRSDRRHVTHAVLARAALDSSDRPFDPRPIPGVPATVDSGRWRFTSSDPQAAPGSGTLCTTHRGMWGWYCAPTSLHGDSLFLGPSADLRTYVRVGHAPRP
jgi:hypothetical protein